MRAEFKNSFAKDVRAIESDRLRQRIREVIEIVEEAESTKHIPNLKRLRKAGSYFRIRIGEYRLGLIIKGQKATFVRCLHRKEVYRYFP